MSLFSEYRYFFMQHILIMVFSSPTPPASLNHLFFSSRQSKQIEAPTKSIRITNIHRETHILTHRYPIKMQSPNILKTCKV